MAGGEALKRDGPGLPGKLARFLNAHAAMLPGIRPKVANRTLKEQGPVVPPGRWFEGPLSGIKPFFWE